MPLTAPTLTVASHTSASITLNIATPASGGTPPYTLTLHRSTHSDYSGDDVTRVVTPGDFPLTVTGLAPETTYYFKVTVMIPPPARQTAQRRAVQRMRCQKRLTGTS
jgi:chitodextrinase